MTTHRPPPADFQRALDNLSPGDRVELTPGLAYPQCTIRAIGAVEQPTVITTRDYQRRRELVDPTATLATITGPPSASNDRAVYFDTEVDNYQFLGVGVTTSNKSPDVETTILIETNTPERNGPEFAKLPRRLAFRECRIFGSGAGLVREGIRFNAVDSLIEHCRFEGFWHKTEAYAIHVTHAQDLVLRGNLLSANGVTVMFGQGGANPHRHQVANVLVEENLFTRSLSQPASKHHIEWKSGKNMIVRRNKFKNSWVGPGISRSYCVYAKQNFNHVSDLYISDNDSEDCDSFCGLAVQEIATPEQFPVMANFVIVNNRHGGSLAAGDNDNRLLSLSRAENCPALRGVYVADLRGVADGQAHSEVFFSGSSPACGTQQLKLFNVLWDRPSRYGVKGNGTASGWASIEQWAPEAVWTQDSPPGYPAAPTLPPVSVDDGGTVPEPPDPVDPPIPPEPPPNGDVDDMIRLHCDQIDVHTAAIRGLLGD